MRRGLRGALLVRDLLPLLELLAESVDGSVMELLVLESSLMSMSVGDLLLCVESCSLVMGNSSLSPVTAKSLTSTWSNQDRGLLLGGTRGESADPSLQELRLLRLLRLPAVLMLL